MRHLVIILLAGLLTTIVAAGHGGAGEPGPPPSEFLPLAADLEYLREVLAIPGLSVAVVRDGEIAWEQGFGFAASQTESKSTSTLRTASPPSPNRWPP